MTLVYRAGKIWACEVLTVGTEHWVVHKEIPKVNILPVRSRASLIYLNNRVFLSRNYRLIVSPRKFDVLKKIFAQEAKLRGQICWFSEHQLPRGNYLADKSQTETLYCPYCSPLNFLPSASIQKRASRIIIT